MKERLLIPRINVPWPQENQPQPERCLSAREIERVAGVSAGDSIVCTYGVLWVTQENDPQDYLLGEGEQVVASRLGLVLVQALRDSACRFLCG